AEQRDIILEAPARGAVGAELRLHRARGAAAVFQGAALDRRSAPRGRGLDTEEIVAGSAARVLRHVAAPVRLESSLSEQGDRADAELAGRLLGIRPESAREAGLLGARCASGRRAVARCRVR